MTKTKLLLINYFPNWLVNELIKLDYEVTIASTNFKNYLQKNFSVKKFDLIYFAKFYPPLWDDLAVLSLGKKIPLIYAFHHPSFIFHPYRLTNYLTNIISLTKLAYIKMARKVSAIHVLNTTEYNMLKSFGFRCFYTPLGVDTNLFKIDVKRNKFTVVFCGPRYGKGADMLARIISCVLKGAPEIEFILTGRGFLNNHFKLIRNFYKGNVHVYKFLEQKEFAKLLSTSHILLFPSRFESFGLVVIEALSSGMPVLCFDIPGAPRDVVKKYEVGIVAEPFNIERLIDGILDYYYLWKEDPVLFKNLSLKCRSIALKYDAGIVTRLFDRMFTEVKARII